MKYLTTIFCLTILVLLGGMGSSLGEGGLTGEYLRALKTMGGSGLEWVDVIFRYCVVLLVDVAKVLGISYEEINIWVFIVIYPLIVIILFFWIFRLRRRIKVLER
jgi:hypothetical protein